MQFCWRAQISKTKLSDLTLESAARRGLFVETDIGKAMGKEKKSTKKFKKNQRKIEIKKKSSGASKQTTASDASKLQKTSGSVLKSKPVSRKKRKTDQLSKVKSTDSSAKSDGPGLEIYKENDEKDGLMDGSDNDADLLSFNADSSDEDISDDDEDIENLVFEDEKLVESYNEDVDMTVPGSEDEENDNQSDALIDEINFLKNQLESLKRQDPAYYKVLAKTDQRLLNIGDAGGDKKRKGNQIHNDEIEEIEADKCELLTMELVISWKQLMINQSSQKSIQKILLAVRAAVALGKENTEVFNALVMTFLKHLPTALNEHLLSEKDIKSKRLPSQTTKWKKLQPLAKSYVKNLLGFLKQITDPDMLHFVLTKCEQAIPYVVCFPKLGKELVKLLVSFWGGIEQSISVIAYLNLLKLVLWCPSPYLDLSLKELYVKLVASCRNTSTFDTSHIIFLSNSFAEICGLHHITTYQYAFSYIRQLTIHLRNALASDTKDAFKDVYNWQYLNCLRIWGNVLSIQCKTDDTLRPLLYPLIQVIIGALRLKPSTKYIPFRLQLLFLLNKIAKSTNTFIPIVSHILDILECNEIRSISKKKSTLPPFNVPINIKVSSQYLGTKQLSDSVVDESVGVLLEFFDLWATFIGFPELGLPALVTLRRLKKRGVTRVSPIIEKIEQNAKWIESKRAEVGFSPRDEEKVREFANSLNRSDSPLCKYVESRRKIIENQLKIQGANLIGENRPSIEDESDEEYDKNLVKMEEDDDEEIDEEYDDVEIKQKKLSK
ncbi:Nucleolar Complex 2 protein, partial [Nowakowskiella sp. JEL0078]